MPRPMPLQPTRLRAIAQGQRRSEQIGVDREAKVIRGYVVAQEGPFKDGRGEFDRTGLQMIVDMMRANPKGLKSRFTHPGLSSDGLGKFLGRALNPRMSTVELMRDGQPVTCLCVRADLQLSETAFEGNPNGNLGAYVMDLAESDSDALSSSLVLEPNRETRLNPDGTAQVDADGERLPDLWRPARLFASDILDEGAAVDGLLSAQLVADGELPDDAVRLASGILDQVFAGQARDVVGARCLAFVDRYLVQRYGPVKTTPVEILRRGLQNREKIS